MQLSDTATTPTRTVIRRDLDLAITRWSGHVTLDEMVQSHESYISNPDYRVGRPHLYDVSDVVFPEIDQAGIEKYISMVSHQDFGPDGVTVTVFAPSNILYGLARQYQSIVESRSPIMVRVFRDEAEAVASVGQAGQTINELMGSARR